MTVAVAVAVVVAVVVAAVGQTQINNSTAINLRLHRSSMYPPWLNLRAVDVFPSEFS